jgi:hypothetical protein
MWVGANPSGGQFVMTFRTWGKIIILSSIVLLCSTRELKMFVTNPIFLSSKKAKENAVCLGL